MSPANYNYLKSQFNGLEPDVDAEVRKTLSHSPTLDIFESDIEAAYAESIQTRSTFYPQVDLQLNGTTGHDLDGVDGGNSGASALVVANWNLYRGGGDMARSREFIHRHQQSKESRARAGREVENDVRTTWASMVPPANAPRNSRHKPMQYRGREGRIRTNSILIAVRCSMFSTRKTNCSYRAATRSIRSFRDAGGLPLDGAQRRALALDGFTISA